MGLGKALGLSLIAFIGLNFLFVIIVQTISGDLNTLFSNITSDPLIILLIFFGPITNVPSSAITMIAFGTFDATLIRAIALIVTPFVASIVAGRTGGSKGASFGGWMIACLISFAALGVLVFINPVTLSYYGIIVLNPVDKLAEIGISAAVNGVFYGCFALLFTKTEMY